MPSLRAGDRAARVRGGDRVAGRAVPRAAGVRGGAPGAGGARGRRDRLLALLGQAAVVLRAHLWEAEPAASGARVPGRARAGRGGLPGLPARLRAGRATLARKARRRASRATSCAAGPSAARGGDYFSAAAAVPACRRARPDRRLPGAQAARGRPAARQIRQLARGRALPQGRRPLRAGPGKQAIARQDGGCGRGQHGRARAAPGRPRARRRLDGDGAHRAPAAASSRLRATLPLLRR